MRFKEYFMILLTMFFLLSCSEKITYRESISPEEYEEKMAVCTSLCEAYQYSCRGLIIQFLEDEHFAKHYASCTYTEGNRLWYKEIKI